MISAKGCEKLYKFVEVTAKILSIPFFWDTVNILSVFQKRHPFKLNNIVKSRLELVSIILLTRYW